MKYITSELTFTLAFMKKKLEYGVHSSISTIHLCAHKNVYHYRRSQSCLFIIAEYLNTKKLKHFGSKYLCTKMLKHYNTMITICHLHNLLLSTMLILLKSTMLILLKV